MNKLLQHIMDAGGGADKFLPYLEQFQTKGEYKGKSPLQTLAARQAPIYDNIPNPAIYKAKAEMDIKAKQHAAYQAMLKKQQDEQIVQDRKDRIKASEEARKRPFSAQQLADETQATGDKFRLFPDDPHSFIDDWLNPGVFIGNLASGLGRVPLNIQQGNYGQAALDAAMPALMGAGEKLIEPVLKGAGKYLTTQTPLKNAYKINPWAFKANPEAYYRMLGKEGYEDALSIGKLGPKKGGGFNEAYYSKGFPLDKVVYPKIAKEKGLAKNASTYEGPYMAEVRGEQELFSNPAWTASYSGPDTDFLIQHSVNDIPLSNPNVNIYKQDWLRGYKPIKIPSADKAYPAFGKANSNSGLGSFLMSRGIEVNPVGIIKDHASGLLKGAGEQFTGLLRETGLFPNKTPRRPFFETFPITKAQKAKMRAMQDEAMNDALEFTKKYWYGDNAEDLRPVLENKIRAIVPDLKRANLPNNLERSSVNNPFNKIEDRLVTNTTWGKGRENLNEDVINYLNNKRGKIAGVNIEGDKSITLRNSGLYYRTPKEIAEIVAHEAGHTAQKFGPIADFKQNTNFAVDQPWHNVLTTYDPKYEYFTSNPNTDLGKRFGEALVKPKKGSFKQTWKSSPDELHSELMTGKYNLYKQGIKQGFSPEEMMTRLTNPSEKELDWIIKNMRLDRHFKPGTSLEERRSLMKLLPAAVPAVFGAGMLDEKEEGGEADEPKQYTGYSIVDYLATKGYSGKKAFRKGLAEEYGVEDYDFSAKKNLELLARMRENDELLKAKKEDFTPIPVERIEQMYAERAAQQPSVQPIVNAVQEQKKAEEQKRLNDLRRRMTLELGFDPFVEGPKAKKIEAPKLSLSSKNPYGAFNLFTGFGNQGSTKQQPAAPVQNKPAPVVQQPVAAPAVAKTAPFRFDLAPVPKPGDAHSFIQFPPYPTKQMAQLPKGRTAEVAAKELEKEEDNRAWYEKLWDSYSEAVNNSQIFGKGKSGITLGGAGFTPEGAKIITRDLTKGVLSVVSEDLAEKYKNKMERQDAKLNPNERKSVLDPSKVKFDPVYVTGDTIPDTKRRYHIPEVIDLDYMRFGVRNRGDLREIQTEGAPITTFEPFQSSKQYFAKTKDPANATYVGVAPDGRIKVGGRDQFQDQDYQVTRTYGNKIVDFNRDATGSIVKVPSNPKASKETLSPSVKVLGDDGKVVDGKLSLLLPRTGNQEESFDLVTGGRYILQTPDGKTKLVSGSLKNIETEFYKMKQNHPWVNVITLDNGSYARGIRTFDQKLTKQDLKGYDNQNTGGGNFAYILPGERKTRYESKFTDFEAEAKRKLQSMYPGRKVSIGFQNEGLYDQTGGRDIESQVGIQKKGNSQTPVSLHNFGAAKDYILYVDGKPIDPEQFKKLYKDVLWGAADKTGLHHLEDWDVAHISLAKEGQKTAFDELYAKYPDIFAHPNFLRSLNYINKNKNNPLYEEYYELLNNLQPFTGKPRTTEVMKRTMAKKKHGGPVVSEYGQWAYPGMDTIVPSGDITMKGVPYPVYGQDETGYAQMMYPGGEYTFPGNFVYEVPMMSKGGQHGGLDRWFAEKWVDVKTGKACGRQEGENRSYPACRPSKRISSKTPKTSSEMSSAEKAKFKRTKTSSERIPYNHKRN